MEGAEYITDTSKRDYVLKGEEGKEYEFVVTATNKYGESLKTEKKTVKVFKGTVRLSNVTKLSERWFRFAACSSFLKSTKIGYYSF